MSLDWALIQYNLCPYKNKRLGLRHTQKEDPMRTQGEGGHLQTQERDLQKKSTLSIPEHVGYDKVLNIDPCAI